MSWCGDLRQIAEVSLRRRLASLLVPLPVLRLVLRAAVGGGEASRADLERLSELLRGRAARQRARAQAEAIVAGGYLLFRQARALHIIHLERLHVRKPRRIVPKVVPGRQVLVQQIVVVIAPVLVIEPCCRH